MASFVLARALLSVTLVTAVATPAGAEIVRLTNGRTITVELCRFEGDEVTLVLRGGGEVRLASNVIDELLPDEVPFARAAAIQALSVSAAATGPQLAAGAIRALVDRVAARVGLDARLAHAVVRAESNYNPRAISPVGAMGLMQIMPVIARQYGVLDPFNPEENLEAGMKHLQSLRRRLDVPRALAAYNAGEAAVARYGGIPPYRETQTYVRRILTLLR